MFDGSVNNPDKSGKETLRGEQSPKSFVRVNRNKRRRDETAIYSCNYDGLKIHFASTCTVSFFT